MNDVDHTDDLERMQGLIAREQRFTERHPSVYPVAVQVHRARRRWRWIRSDASWAQAYTDERLPVRIKRHNSLLRRTLSEDEMHLQHGKVRNLELASTKLDGLLVRPGETVSFNRVVGNCTRRKGYVDGMRLSNGEALSGVGGGICQLANLVHWMVLHSPMTVTERSEHSFDPFPDNERVLPWGTGCSIVYNYVDLCFRNDTDIAFTLNVRVGDRYLEGELRASTSPEHSYSVFARNEEFLRLGDEYFRRNEIWRSVIDRRTGNRVGEELLRRNCALVKYLPTDVDITEITPAGGVVSDPRRQGAMG